MDEREVQECYLKAFVFARSSWSRQGAGGREQGETLAIGQRHLRIECLYFLPVAPSGCYESSGYSYCESSGYSYCESSGYGYCVSGSYSGRHHAYAENASGSVIPRLLRLSSQRSVPGPDASSRRSQATKARLLRALWCRRRLMRSMASWG